VNCYNCEQPATNACKRCAKPYCDEHGNAAYCSDCLQPSSALPSFNLYRGALLTMLVGTALAVFLIMRPPGETRSASPVVVGRLTPTARSGTEQATIPVETPPAATATPEPTAEPTEAPFNEHVIVDGDTLYGIAEIYLTPGDDIDAFARAIANLNGLDFDAPILTPGETLLLPKPPEPATPEPDGDEPVE
jgi:hypothetical protein